MVGRRVGLGGAAAASSPHDSVTSEIPQREPRYHNSKTNSTRHCSLMFAEHERAGQCDYTSI